MPIIKLGKVHRAVTAYEALNPDERKEFRRLLDLMTYAEAAGKGEK